MCIPYVLTCICVCICVYVCAGTSSKQAQTLDQTKRSVPHIFFVLVDDLGSADVGFTRFDGYDPSTNPEVQTPALNKLAAEGVLLMRHYVHYVCTPTRSAVQTGRLPVHVQTSLKNPEIESSGIPRNMRCTLLNISHSGLRIAF